MYKHAIELYQLYDKSVISDLYAKFFVICTLSDNAGLTGLYADW